MAKFTPALSTSETSAATNGGANDNNKFPFKKLSQMWQTNHRDDLKLRHLTGEWLNEQHGPPTKRQAYGEGTLRQYVEKLGVAESDLSRMRWFAFYFKSLKELKEKEPTATTWTKVKDVIARRRHPQAVPVVKPQSDDKKLVVAERSVDQLIGAVRAIQSHVSKVGKLTMYGDDWKAVIGALNDVLGSCLGGQITLTSTAATDQPVPSMATTDLVAQARMREFESASGEIPAAVVSSASDSQFKPLL